MYILQIILDIEFIIIMQIVHLIYLNSGHYSFLPRDARAERGYATVSRLSVRLSVCLSVTIRYHDHMVGILRK